MRSTNATRARAIWIFQLRRIAGYATQQTSNMRSAWNNELVETSSRSGGQIASDAPACPAGTASRPVTPEPSTSTAAVTTPSTIATTTADVSKGIRNVVGWLKQVNQLCCLPIIPHQYRFNVLCVCVWSVVVVVVRSGYIYFLMLYASLMYSIIVQNVVKIDCVLIFVLQLIVLNMVF